ncbi:MAG TPA: secondary thiamine-phosphate synthase enzyme YjbQ, partial [Candidatus Paceibacterota bacterium]|nr:secondary thiamine-phosphate synthase enzyme YjbQ [Candidatus Paceibacterota bacterium]
MKELIIKTKKDKEVVDITENIQKIIDQEKINSGIINVFITHTTAALSTADLDPGTDKDMLDAFDHIIPDLDYRHPHNPEHVPDHIISTLIGSHVSVPVKSGSLILGTWQRIVL